MGLTLQSKIPSYRYITVLNMYVLLFMHDITIKVTPK